MKKLALSTRPAMGQKIEDFLDDTIAKINDASLVQPAENAANAITLTNFDVTTDVLLDFDVSAATLAELRQVVASLIRYIQTGGIIEV